MLGQIVLPVGPVTLYWTTLPDSGRLEPRVNLGRTIYLARLALDPELQLDWRATLSAGAPVFEARGRIMRGENGSTLGGQELWGTVIVSDTRLLPPADRRQILSHERVHLIQDDFLTISWAGPAEYWLLGKLPDGEVVRRYVDPGLVYMGMAGVLFVIFPYESRPWEAEAYYLERGR